MLLLREKLAAVSSWSGQSRSRLSAAVITSAVGWGVYRMAAGFTPAGPPCRGSRLLLRWAPER